MENSHRDYLKIIKNIKLYFVMMMHERTMPHTSMYRWTILDNANGSNQQSAEIFKFDHIEMNIDSLSCLLSNAQAIRRT